jgi:hypothetical protein
LLLGFKFDTLIANSHHKQYEIKNRVSRIKYDKGKQEDIKRAFLYLTFENRKEDKKLDGLN